MADNHARDQRTQPQGISNRETPDEEARERQTHPPLREGSPPDDEASAATGEGPIDDTRDEQSSDKSGVQSGAQKADESRYPDRAMPPTKPVPGAFGREP